MKKFKIQSHHPLLLSAVLLSLSGCGNVKESLGLDKDAPDEFSVVRHAPLEMPSSLALPPPRPGMGRPQEQTTSVQAQQAIFGQKTVQTSEGTSSAETALLQQTGAPQADPNIRQTLDVESTKMEQQNRPVIDKILMKSGKKVESTAETLDPKVESQRLKTQQIPTPQVPQAILDSEEKE